MRIFKKINPITGMFVEDCLFNYPPYLTETVLQDFTDEEGITTQQPVYDPQYIEDDVPQGFYWPKWNGTEWVEGGVAPEPVPPVPTDVERILAIEEAIDFLLMGGM